MSQLLKYGAHLTVRGLLSVMTLLPLAANAAAPVYFDLGGLIIYAALYVLGLLALAIAIIRAKGLARIFFLVTLLAYIATPIAYVLHSAANLDSHNAKITEEQKNGEAANLDAFSQYCKDRNREIISSVAPQTNESLAVRFDPAFTGILWNFNAHPLREYLRDKSSLCQQGTLLFLEGKYDGRYVEKRGTEIEVRRYAICSHEKWTIEPKLGSRYELILGEQSQRDSVPWGADGGRWISKSSVRLVDKSSGMTLARDTMYFMQYEPGKAACPDGLEQISKLITDTFQKK